MKLSEYRKRSNEYTAKASEIVRQLALAGVAIIWLFKDKDINALQRGTIIPLIALGLALLFDLTQYIIAGQIWIHFFNKEEKKYGEQEDPEVKAPIHLKKPVYFFYWGKIIALLAAYIFIIHLLYTHLNFN